MVNGYCGCLNNTEVEGNLNIAAALKNKTVHLFLKGCIEMFTSHKSPFIFWNGLLKIFPPITP
jgi:hypothetical protein